MPVKSFDPAQELAVVSTTDQHLHTQGDLCNLAKREKHTPFNAIDGHGHL